MILYEILITSTALICGIFCLRKLSKGKISMRLRYALWLLVAVRLLVPASVGTSALSVMNLVPVVMRERAQTFSLKRGTAGVCLRTADVMWRLTVGRTAYLLMGGIWERS